MTEEKLKTHTLKVRDILSCSWGYGQTNVDFYQVTESGKKYVKIEKIETRIVSGDGFSDRVVPGDRLGNKPLLKIPRPNNSIKIASYADAYKWDGHSLHQTDPRAGH
jgi:hypothetical protein